MERCLALVLRSFSEGGCEANAVGTVKCFRFPAFPAHPAFSSLVPIDVLTRLDGSLKAGSQLRI